MAHSGRHDILSVDDAVSGAVTARERSPSPGGLPEARGYRAGSGRAFPRRACLVLDTGRGRQRALDDLVTAARQVGTAVESVIDGKAETVRLAVTVLLAEGHLLI